MDTIRSWVASGSKVAVLGFEWVRLSASAFLRQFGVDNALQRKDTVQASFLLAAVTICLLAALSVPWFSVGC